MGSKGVGPKLAYRYVLNHEKFINAQQVYSSDCTYVREPNLFPGEIDLFFFDVIAL